MAFNVAERIKQVREVEAKIKVMEEEFDVKVKPFEDFANAARVQILQHLNETGQKSAPTLMGTAYKKAKVTYRVSDREEFMRHVIGTEQWELIGWSAAGVACEEWTTAHNAPPPGLERSSVIMLYINAPPKPRKKVTETAQPEPGSDEYEDAKRNQVETL